MKNTIHLHAPATITHGQALATAAIALSAHATHPAGEHEHSMRELFEDAIDLLQRHAKRVALASFDNANMQASIEEAAAARKAKP